jgi:DNA repair protein RecO
MAYATYTTEALVCGTFDRNTADRSYLLFTREAGMLYADARSVREERSRQRYSLQDFTLVRASLVKGKGGWKVGSIQALNNFYHEAVDQVARGSVVSIFRLLRRFFKGQESAPELFDYVVLAVKKLTSTQSDRAFLQMLVQVHILAELGYVDSQLLPSALQNRTHISLDTTHYSESDERLIEQLYTQAVSASHL